ncbi:high frequency lysogenization protein HflD [Aliikangiella sp. G2MR2-5]|uniref:high frequency lysogenization protein HflD n=1 Tax=Aliikangiella sp. G2MR2-5 TaxID=2788943 RepID=UPI0018AB92EC|nr:high frequency lysogenization protein HflD [Aliikangiella sp. G2MR2-5]
MSKNNQLLGQCIGLGALSQAIRSVQNLAWKGQTNLSDLRAVVSSLVEIDAGSPVDIYGGSFELNNGLRLLARQIDPQDKDKDPEFVNLAINLISLQAQLNKNNDILTTLTQKIDQLAQRFSGSDIAENEESYQQFINEASEIYKQTLSKMPLRIQVKGEPKFLQQPMIQAQIRASLLAAIRAIFLWRQSGGTRWHFLFKKRQLLSAIKNLIASPVSK